MHKGSRWLRLLLMGSILIVPTVITGCAQHTTRVWNNNEVEPYQRWEGETHRDHKDFTERNPGEQKEYWTWRDSHPDRH
jgi:hypothetical protein